jgi:very-short-patch-repair endonuclease
VRGQRANTTRFAHICQAAPKKSTDAESLIWSLLRGRRFGGFKFRRQHPMGHYILDFYCHDATLAIELDGGGHAEAEQAEYDQIRSQELDGAGIRVLRFWNNEVLMETEAVLAVIWIALSDE